MTAFSETLVRLLEKKQAAAPNFDKKELARRIRKTYAYVNSLCNGTRKEPKPAMAEIIANVLGASEQERRQLLEPCVRRVYGNVKDEFFARKNGPELQALNSPLLAALLGRLPEPGTAWPQQDRENWLRALSAAFELEYKPAQPPGLTGH